MVKGLKGLSSHSSAYLGGLTIFDQAVVSVTNYLTGVIIGRVCTKGEFGLYMLGFSVVLVIIESQKSLLLSPYTMYIPRLKGDALNQYVASTFVHHLFFSALVVVALALGAVMFSFGVGPHGFMAVAWAIAAAISFILLREYARRVCFASFLPKTALAIDCVASVVQIGGLLFLAKTGLLSASRTYWVSGGASSVASIGWLISRQQTLSLQMAHPIVDLRRNWEFGKWVLAGNITSLISIQLYPWYLSIFQDTVATGIFAACWGTVAVINPFFLGIGNFIAPKAAHAFVGGGEEFRRVVLKATIWISAATSLFCTIMLIYGGKLVVIMYGSKYTGNDLIMSVLALSVMALAIGFAPDYAIWAIERPKSNFKINLLCLGMTLTLGLWLVKFFGAIGAAYGYLVVTTFGSALRNLTFKKLVNSLLM